MNTLERSSSSQASMEERVEAGRRLVENHDRAMDSSWQSQEKLGLVYLALIAGYQAALWRTLGPGVNSMEQLLLEEVGGLLQGVLEEVNIRTTGGLEEAVSTALRSLGVARTVEVCRASGDGKEGCKGEKILVRIADSYYKPVHLVLRRRGLEKFPLSPEALLVATLVRAKLAGDRGRSVEDVRVRVEARLPASEEEPLEILVEQIEPVTRRDLEEGKGRIG